MYKRQVYDNQVPGLARGNHIVNAAGNAQKTDQSGNEQGQEFPRSFGEKQGIVKIGIAERLSLIHIFLYHKFAFCAIVVYNKLCIAGL